MCNEIPAGGRLYYRIIVISAYNLRPTYISGGYNSLTAKASTMVTRVVRRVTFTAIALTSTYKFKRLLVMATRTIDSSLYPEYWAIRVVLVIGYWFASVELLFPTYGITIENSLSYVSTLTMDLLSWTLRLVFDSSSFSFHHSTTIVESTVRDEHDRY